MRFMSAKKHRYASDPHARHSGRVKRSITVWPDIDVALREIVADGDGNYSQVANEAFTLYLQARGIDTIERDIVAATGPITRDEELEAERRLEDARRRALSRRRTTA
jgi:hypothetical protein